MARIRKDKGVAGKRSPATTAMPVLKQLFDHMDEFKIPYYVVGHNEDVVRWRKGTRGMSVWSLITLADTLGFDIVALPRQPAPAQGHTLAAPVAAVATHSGEGMVAPGAAPALGRAA